MAAAAVVADEEGVPVGIFAQHPLEDEEGYSSSSSSSSSSSFCAPAPPPFSHAGCGKGKRKSPPPPPAGQRPAKKPRTAKKQEISRDASLVASLPVVAFIEARFTPKACGHCSYCHAPPCGTCKTCLLNAKLGPSKQKDKRRCENLTCIRILAKQQPPADAPASPAPDLEVVTEELADVSSQLATISAQRGSHGFDDAKYRSLIERKKQLHMAKVKAKARKSKRKTPFPTGAHEAWGVVSCLEKIRQKFAKFAVKNSASDGCKRTVAIKRQMRDELDTIILQWCTRFSDVIAPQNEEEQFLNLLDTAREAPEDSQ
jgi:hypothetical protein